jgi:hypothetical protein
LRWGQANVVVDFGGATLDVTAAGEAAVKLAEATGQVWEEYREKALRKTAEEPPNDGVPRMLELTTSVSTVIGGEDEGHIMAGTSALGKATVMVKVGTAACSGGAGTLVLPRGAVSIARVAD